MSRIVYLMKPFYVNSKYIYYSHMRLSLYFLHII